jgi:hypothetical protein
LVVKLSESLVLDNVPPPKVANASTVSCTTYE